MPIYGLRVGSAGQPQYYNISESARIGDRVLVPVEHSSMMAVVVSGPLKALPGAKAEELPQILRFASSSDLAVQEDNDKLRKEAFAFCRERIHERKLDMKLVDVDIQFDRAKYIFYFTAPGRIDFRELVKDLVREYRSRIELRQIGVRHETQRLGAIGNCGQICCCRRFLKKFAPVTIKMAKEQNLFLNPSKISGICGRLLCCLAHEQENYETFHQTAPRTGKKYQTRNGIFKVLRSDMFKNTVCLLSENNVKSEISLEEWQTLEPARLGHDDPSCENDADDAPDHNEAADQDDY